MKNKMCLKLFLLFVGGLFTIRIGLSVHQESIQNIITTLSSNNFENKNEINKFMKRMRVSDQSYVDAIEKLEVEKLTEVEAREKFYEMVQKPVQGVCRTLKRLGGEWMDWGKALDGDKFVCFDNIRPENCIVYSFGINNEWTFEDLISSVGCDVWAHDPSHTAPEKRGDRIHFEQTGLSNYTEESHHVATLDHFMKKNGHSEKQISYLKADVEGWEMWALPQWIRDGTLVNVNQFALELHMPGYHEPPKFKWLLEILQGLHKLNFRIISYEANLAAGKIDGYYQYMELVWMKDQVWSFLDQ